MSQRPVQKELPRNTQVMEALRRELNRNSQQITKTFWHEFEQIRSLQRRQLQQERLERARITTLMHDTTLETQQQADEISRSISAHGINPVAPSPLMQRDRPTAHPSTEEVLHEVRNGFNFRRPESAKAELPKPSIPLRSTAQAVEAAGSKTPAKPSVEPYPSTISLMPPAPHSSRETILGNKRTPPRSAPTMHRLNLATKPK